MGFVGPTFFQALGRALGWEEKMDYGTIGVYWKQVKY